ncbi:MAG TPA: nuclear transport factor 2 family protein [Bacteroidales bacterium]|nr:nuclear transport factor 2 family protein [Bacteroidales bacterium]
MKHLIILFITITALTLNAQNISVKNHYEIASVLSRQQKCWNTGDIEGYMSGYWESDSMKFITKTGVTTGWKNTLEMYKQHYPSKEAMGTLIFDEVDMIQMNAVTVFVMGRWTLQKTNETVGGRFTLVVKKIDGKWKIIIDHSS